MKQLERVERDVELWRITHPVDKSVEAFIVKDPRRTPENWAFGNREEATAKFDERVRHAETNPPLI